jgi:hypothetical protein
MATKRRAERRTKNDETQDAPPKNSAIALIDYQPRYVSGCVR